MQINTVLRSRVHDSHNCRIEAVLHPGGVGPNTPQPPARREEGEQTVCRVGGILHDAGSLVSASAGVNVTEGRKAASGDLLGRLHHPL